MSRTRTPGAFLLAQSFCFHSEYGVASNKEEAGFHQSSLSHGVHLIPSVLDCWSQETRPGCHHPLGGQGHLASPRGLCATEPPNYCRLERSAPLSSGSGLCLQASQDEARLRRAESRPLWVYTVLGQPCASHCLLVSGCLGTKTPRLLGTIKLSVYCLLYQTELCKGGNGISPMLASSGSSSGPGT